MKKIIPVILLLFCVTGCWNYRELNQLAITTGIAIDKEEDNYVMTIMIANSKKPGGSSDSNQPSTAVYEGKGKTMYEAIKHASLNVSKQIYLGHIDILLFSEEIAKNDMQYVIDFIFRYPQTRNNFLLALVRDGKAGDVLKIATPLETFPSQNIARNLEITEKLQGLVYTVEYNQFVKDLIEEGMNPVLPGISVIGDVEEGNKEENVEQSEPSTYLRLEPMALFRDNQFLTWSNEDQSKGINVLNNKINTLGVVVPCENGTVVTEVINLKSSFEVNAQEKKVKIKVKAIGGIQELSCKLDLEDSKIIEEIEKKDNEMITQYIKEALLLAQEYKTDIFGFGNAVYKKEPNYFKEIKETWNEEIFPNLQPEIEVDLHLTAKGTINSDIEVNS